MVNEFRFLLAELKKNPLPTVCGVLIAAVVYMVLYIVDDIKRDNEIEAAYRQELVATEKRCAADKDALRIEQIKRLEELYAAQQRINEKISKRK